MGNIIITSLWAIVCLAGLVSLGCSVTMLVMQIKYPDIDFEN